MTTTPNEVAVVIRVAWPRVVATLTRQFGDLQDAENATQEAAITAATSWVDAGIPAAPEAWLLTAARRKHADFMKSSARRRSREERHLASTAPLTDAIPTTFEPLGDDPLGLMFMCCHPSLSLDARVALTLRAVGGLTTAEIAAGFAATEATIHQRIVRAKRKIRTNALQFEVPDLLIVNERLADVHAVIYLIFNEGYAASHGTDIVRESLCEEAIRLCGLLLDMLPDHAETRGLYALIRLHHARRATRQWNGRAVKLSEQDRSLWDHDTIRDAAALLEATLRLGRVGQYQLQASIAALHAQAPSFAKTDWPQIAGLYGVLRRFTPTPAVLVNHAVAASLAEDPQAGLTLLEPFVLSGELDDYPAFHAARADMYLRAGDHAAAQRSWLITKRLTSNPFWQDEIAEHLAQHAPSQFGQSTDPDSLFEQR
jgi:RNA polymerase sigma-70 factor, ECF subfamily